MTEHTGLLVPENRHKRYNESVKGRARTKRKVRKHSDALAEEYLTRQFIAWDGEGTTIASGEHLYVLMAASDGHEVQEIVNPEGIPSVVLLDWIIKTDEHFRAEHDRPINVIYGGGYDFNMLLKDFPHEQISNVLDQSYARVSSENRAFRIGWRPGKQMEIKRYNTTENPDRASQNVILYDVVSFFQCTFVKACDKYLGDKWLKRDLIVASKANRSEFQVEDLPVIREYCAAELANLIDLMDELRIRLDRVGLRVQRWIGPGAIAAALMTREGVKKCRAVCPPEVASAARFAYTGGRFELIKFGVFRRRVIEYDINSAYPDALRHVPDLTAGSWGWSDEFVPGSFGLWHTSWDVERADLPSPLWMRVHTGQVFYPPQGRNWFWTPEVETALEYCSRWPGTITVKGGWVFVPSPGASKPFAFISPLFDRRRRLKEAGDGAEGVIKTALNSLYGKLAQQIGWKLNADGTPRIPSFHQLEWAGYATAWCRAKILRACLPDLENVISFETDAVFTFTDLDIPIEPGLGAFSKSEYTGMTVWQSGKYFLDLPNGDVVVKARGIDRGTLSRKAIEGALLEHEIAPVPELPTDADRRSKIAAAQALRDREDAIGDALTVRGTHSQFIGARLARARNWENWCRWITAPVQTHPRGLNGKRIHPECTPECRGGESAWSINQAHATWPAFTCADHSIEFPDEWINPDPDLQIAARREDHATEAGEID